MGLYLQWDVIYLSILESLYSGVIMRMMGIYLVGLSDYQWNAMLK
jgi:hypothetical protein